jgi:hypothetical protein
LKCDFNKNGQLKSAVLMDNKERKLQNLKEGFLQYYSENILNEKKNGIFCNFEYVFQGQLEVPNPEVKIHSERILPTTLSMNSFHSEKKIAKSMYMKERGSWGLDEFSKIDPIQKIPTSLNNSR